MIPGGSLLLLLEMVLCDLLQLSWHSQNKSLLLYSRLCNGEWNIQNGMQRAKAYLEKTAAWTMLEVTIKYYEIECC